MKLATILLLSALSLTGCASSEPPTFVPPDSGTGVDAGIDVVDASADTFRALFDAGTCPPGAPTTCDPSSFNVVVDCNGSHVKTCNPDQGCSKGQCIPACDAVAAAQTTLGCEFYTHIPDATQGGPTGGDPGPGYDGSCFAAAITNTWSTDLDVRVEFGGKPLALDPAAFIRVVDASGGDAGNATVSYVPPTNGKVPAGKVAMLFLSGAPGAGWPCPSGVTPAVIVDQQTDLHGMSFLSAFHISTSAPVSAYDVYPFQGAHGGGPNTTTNPIPGATLLLPLSSWGTNYITVDPSQTFVAMMTAWVSVVASAPNTHVTFVSPVDIPAVGQIPGARRGVPVTYTLQAGQGVEVAQGPEFAGAPIVSDQPVAVFGGHQCLMLPRPWELFSYNGWYSGNAPCDAAHAQIPAIPSWGTVYAAAPLLRSPSDAMSMRLVGAVDGTTLTYVPSAPSGAPTTLSKGQVADFSWSGAFTVASQDDAHPFYGASLMTNCEVSGVGSIGPSCGDPEFLNLQPPATFMTGYTVFADPTYANAVFAIVEQKTSTASTFDDVTIDCHGTIQASEWTAISGTNYRYANVYLRADGTGVGTCDAGVRAVTSKSPFGLTVWGLDTQASYAFVAGMSTRPLTNTFVPASPTQ
jgi:hypothetical protein